MTTFESARQPDTDGLEISIVQGFWVSVMWAVGLVSMIYLVGWACFWVFLTVVFGSPDADLGVLRYLGTIAASAVPACCYAVIGLVGLCFVSSARFRILGVSGILAEAALAIDAYVSPETLPLFADWLQ